MKSPTARSLDYCRKLGMFVDVVEHWQVGANRRKDLFGFIDIVALAADPRIIWIQCTSQSNRANREHKILNEHAQEAKLLMDCNTWVECWGWMKSKRTGRWQLTRRRLGSDFEWREVA